MGDRTTWLRVSMNGHMAAISADQLSVLADWGYAEIMSTLRSLGAVDLDKMWDVVFHLIDEIGAPASILSMTQFRAAKT